MISGDRPSPAQPSPARAASKAGAHRAWALPIAIVNSLADVGWMIVGFLLAGRLPVCASVAPGIGFELFTLGIICDSPARNVTLVWPGGAIRDWQAAARRRTSSPNHLRQVRLS
jgi:Protein of unknown function (DUF2585)